MNAGTFEGDIDEIKFVKFFNSNKQSFASYIHSFNLVDNFWMIRVTTKQLSKLSNQKVFTRADAYLIETKQDLSNLVTENDGYLDETILSQNNVTFSFVPFSGVSVKMTSSSNYQILKTGPHSFCELFGSYELGAGASLFCMREEELPKNEELLVGWKTSTTSMCLFFKNITNGDSLFYLNQEVCKEIKNYSCKTIESMINNSKELQEKIFNGKDLYEEPYTAWYFYHGSNLEKLTIIPFSVTTGSGRSHGDYTIVLKPICR